MAQSTVNPYGITIGGADVFNTPAGQEQQMTFNNRGDARLAQSLPSMAEIVRMGRTFSAQMPAGSAFTLLITIPTTRVELALQNGEPAGGKAYVIHRFWVKAVTSMASACALTPLSQLVPPGTAQVANDAAVLRMSMSGAVAIQSNAKIVMASTATGCLTDKWNHHQSAIITPTTNIAACIEVVCNGGYIVPPQGSFNISAQESVSGGTAICGVEWSEIQLTLGN